MLPSDPVPPGELPLAVVLNASLVATFIINARHEVTLWNRACEALTGVPAADMLGRRDAWRVFYPSERPLLADLVVNGDVANIPKHYYPTLVRPSSLIPGAYHADTLLTGRGGRSRWLALTAAPVHDADGNICGAVETLQDVTEQRQTELALQESRAMLAEIIDGSSVATFVIDQNHRVTHWNQACEALTGVPASDMLGSMEQWRAFYNEPRPLMADIVLNGSVDADAEAYYAGKYKPSELLKGAFEAEDFFPGFGDSGRWVFFTAAPIRDSEGRVVGAIETLQDITARKLAEIALRKSEARHRALSQQDSLTQLFNSRHFYERLGQELDRAARYQRPFALLMIDADHFKRVNDTYGHLQGDHVLQTLAKCINQSLRNTDSAYRYGGEEFAVLMPETGHAVASMVAERMRALFEETAIALPGQTVPLRCTVSIGLTEWQEGDHAKGLLQRADKALYRAKSLGRNRVEAG